MVIALSPPPWVVQPSLLRFFLLDGAVFPCPLLEGATPLALLDDSAFALSLCGWRCFPLLPLVGAHYGDTESYVYEDNYRVNGNYSCKYDQRYYHEDNLNYNMIIMMTNTMTMITRSVSSLRVRVSGPIWRTVRITQTQIVHTYGPNK